MGYREDIAKISADRLPWDYLSGKKILVTGASGMIGSCLVDALMARPKIDFHIYASARDQERLKTKFSRYDGS